MPLMRVDPLIDFTLISQASLFISGPEAHKETIRRSLSNPTQMALPHRTKANVKVKTISLRNWILHPFSNQIGYEQKIKLYLYPLNQRDLRY